MNAKKAAIAIISNSIRIIILAVVIIIICQLSSKAYDYGYRVFAEQPMTQGDGQDVMVTIPMGTSVMETGQILENNSLINDKKLFYIQEKLSAYRGKLKPGTYTLNTSMTAEEMMAVMAGSTEASTETAEETVTVPESSAESEEETTEAAD